MLVAALATALAVGGCSRALSTAPATPSNAGPATSLLAKRGAQPAAAARILGPVVAAVQRIVSDPLFVLDPGAPVVTGALEFLPLVDQLVQPGTEATVKGGRWTLQFHAGSLSAATPVSVSEASDGTMRVQFGPDGTQFGTAIDLTIDYSGTSLDPTSPNYQRGTLPQFLYYDPSLGEWVETPSVNDPTQKCVHAKLQHFSTYGLGGKAGW